jgi:hypothetical protein
VRDLYNNLKVVPAFGPIARPSGAGIAIDLQGFEGALVVIQSGAMGAVAATYTWKLQESDSSGSGYTDVAAADMVGGVQTVVFDQSVGGDANQAKKLGYIGSKRYLKAYCTESTAGSPTSIIGATAVLGDARHKPVS